ncbi:MAG TPA: tetratricopeptide repeat protein, partial [Xanthobacteraceae bacterium]|nr:tetratricopeptide repeat protein [Xanthobacteraceae bacterium]
MWRSLKASVSVAVLVAVLALPEPRALAQNARADISINTSAGYGRLVFHFTEYVDADVRLSSNVLIISFRQPVNVGVERIASYNDYFSAARRDPDGRGVRVALSRKVRLNTMVVGERLFIDLLPDEWTGPAPSLPQEVIEDLSRRMREAEKRSRQQQILERQKYVAPNRVRVSRQPTFTRYIFELPDLIAASTERTGSKLTITFDAVLRFDLGDAKAMQPQVVQSLDINTADTTTAVSIAFIGETDVRTFREDNTYVVDILNPETTGNPEAAASLPAVAESASAAGPARMQAVPAYPANARPEMARPGLPPAEPNTAVSPSSLASPGERSVVPASGERPLVPAEAQNMPVVPVKAASTAPVGEKPAPAVGADEARPLMLLGASPSDRGISPALKRQGDGVQLTFQFPEQTAAAIFTRNDTLWMVFEGDSEIQTSALKHEHFRGVTIDRRLGHHIIRIKLDRPRLISAVADDSTWTIDIGDVATNPSQPIAILRSLVTDKRASVQVPFDDVQKVRRISDADVGDDIMVVTALGPARGLPKTQEFVDFRALASLQGLVIQEIADDLTVDVAPDKVLIARPSGLTLTSSSPAGRRSGSLRPSLFDSQQWGFDRQAAFPDRQLGLLTAAAQASEAKRNAFRVDLARFYFAREMYPEAKAVLDVALQDERPTADDTIGLVMRGVAKIYMGRPDDALKDLNNPLVGNQNDAPLWRAFAQARQGKWTEAREGLRRAESVLSSLPLELQRDIMLEGTLASVEVRDFPVAESQLEELETLGSVADVPRVSILTGRIREGLNQTAEALAAYRAAADSPDRAVAAQGRMRDIALRYRLGSLKHAEAIDELESLSAIWRGDETEVEALQLLAQLYLEDKRYRDAFNLMRVALRAHPESHLTRNIQDDAAAAFDQLFLGGKGDSLSPIDALSLFYDFRELTPIGRRGDEMIRRLADRLVAADLLDQAAELLQHQVEHRLQGAARAQVATRLAIVHLLNRKPERALQVLKSTRLSDLSNEVRNQRLMLEARAMSDVGRHGLAVDIAQNLKGPEAARMRSDILWAAKRYRESAEEIERLYSDRFREWTPLSDVERRDILRAAICYAIAEDKLGLER